MFMYIQIMIVSFRCNETKKIMNRDYSPAFSRPVQKIAMRKLWQIDAAAKINDLRIPLLNQLIMVRGIRRGIYLIHINNTCKIRFTWKKNNAYNVKITH